MTLWLAACRFGLLTPKCSHKAEVEQGSDRFVASPFPRVFAVQGEGQTSFQFKPNVQFKPSF